MLRTNLATRPFYNQRAVSLALGTIAAIVIGLTLLNAVRLFTLSRRNTALAVGAERDEAQARTLTEQAAQVRSGLNSKELETVGDAAGEANAIIDQRTFSWTEVFNQIEATLPPDVMVTSVRPDIRDGIVTVSIVVLGRRVEDIDTFMENLETAGSFAEMLSRQEEATDDGMYRSVLVGQYHRQGQPGAVVRVTR